jgi:hypothetical protein
LSLSQNTHLYFSSSNILILSLSTPHIPPLVTYSAILQSLLLPSDSVQLLQFATQPIVLNLSPRAKWMAFFANWLLKIQFPMILSKYTLSIGWHRIKSSGRSTRQCLPYKSTIVTNAVSLPCDSYTSSVSSPTPIDLLTAVDATLNLIA